ncbi:LysR family transcriptional regulator [Novosphingobium sp.]|uniref:LysR family transcriptional regulator n=1 Tax=Novosphingobium sp. TaxID=1874826 RepID=UPI0025ED0BAF|nr:LysR family transcriptional regulator [Novosphingobium sp.]
MTIELRQLRYAVLTADTRSFSRAATTLNMKQATLSLRVTQLEDQLGIKLFNRTTRGAEPTEMGKVFLESARRIITDVDNLQTTARAVSYGDQGRLAVGYSSSLMAGNLKQTFAEYLTRFPDVQFDGVEAGPEKLLSSLLSRTIDVAVAPTGLEDAGIVSRKVWSDRLMITLLANHKLLGNERIHWSDLRREVFVLPNGGIWSDPFQSDRCSAHRTRLSPEHHHAGHQPGKRAEHCYGWSFRDDRDRSITGRDLARPPFSGDT